VHPVREFLRATEWDRKGRLDRWMIDYCGAADTPYTRAVGAKWMISAVARVELPGCQADHMLVLQGEPGLRKSSVLRALATRDEWFHDEVNTRDKDGKIGLEGVWIVEDAELAGLGRADRTTNNAFITRRVEKYRSPYDRWDMRRARQCVFAATTNDKEILVDPVGARRFWFVLVTRDDLRGLIAARDQLWAEAFERFCSGEAWHIEDVALVAAATQEQEARRVPDAWEEPVAAWLARAPAQPKDKPALPANSVAGVTTHDVLAALDVPHHAMTRDAEMRSARVLRQLGWEKCSTKHVRNGVRGDVFFPSDTRCPKHRRPVEREKGTKEVVQVVQVVQPARKTRTNGAQPPRGEVVRVVPRLRDVQRGKNVMRSDPRPRSNGTSNGKGALPRADARR
jgi:putative DNA primase/helicase